MFFFSGKLGEIWASLGEIGAKMVLDMLCFDVKKMRRKSKCSRFICLEVIFGVFFGQVWGSLGKNPRTPKSLPAPTPMSKALWKDPDCEKLKSTFDNLVAVSSSDVDGKQLYEKSLDQCFSTFLRYGLFSDQYKSSRTQNKLRLREWYKH